MAFLERFQKFNHAFSALIEWVGLFAILIMIVITCVDVVGGKLFQIRVFGAIDLVMIAQLVAISFAVAMTLVLDRHVKVEFFVPLLPKRLQPVVDCITYLLGFALFVLIVWRLFAYGYSLQIGGEESATARIPLYPFAYGAAFASVPVCLLYLQKFIESILEVIKHES